MKDMGHCVAEGHSIFIPPPSLMSRFLLTNLFVQTLWKNPQTLPPAPSPPPLFGQSI